MKTRIQNIQSDFYSSFYWLSGHPIFCGEFLRCIDIKPVKVCSKTIRVKDDDAPNTKVEIWLEAGPYHPRCLTHDKDLDGGGLTFEEAIVALKGLVYSKYGTYNCSSDVFKTGGGLGGYGHYKRVTSYDEMVKETDKLIKENAKFYCTIPVEWIEGEVPEWYVLDIYRKGC